MNAPAAPVAHSLFRPAAWLAAPLKAHRGTYAKVAVAAALSNLFALATAFYSMTVYNRIVPANAISSLVALTVGVGLVLVFDFALRMLRGYFVDAAGRSVDLRLGRAIFEQLLETPMARRGGSTGALAGTLREYETLRDFLSSATLLAIIDVPFILLFLLVIALIAGPLALVPLATVPLVLAAAWAVQPGLDRTAEGGMGAGFNKQGVMVEAVGGLETLKSTAAGAMLARRWARTVGEHADLSLASRLFASFAVQVAATAQQMVYVGTVLVGVILVADAKLTVGAVIAASLLAGRCVAPLTQVAQLATRISHARASYRRLDAFMTAPVADMPSVRRTAVEGAISFRHVRFAYPGRPSRVLDDFSLEVRPGERVGVVGRVGSGKSTLARLALGLWAPDEGAVLLDGADLRQWAADDLRAGVGAVLQDVVLFSGSVRDNIALDDPRVDDAALLRAARISGTYDTVGQIAGGFDLRLADRGEGVSGGQRQAMALARALAHDPRVLILDEPTSAMDAQSEAALIARLLPALEGRTLLLISHRPAALRLVDRLVVMADGKVAMDGPRDAVLKRLAAPQAPQPAGPAA